MVDLVTELGKNGVTVMSRVSELVFARLMVEAMVREPVLLSAVKQDRAMEQGSCVPMDND